MPKPTKRPTLSARRPTTVAAAATATATAAARSLTAGEASRLVVDLPIAAHRDLKAKAALEGMTIKAYVLNLLRKAGVASL